MMNLYLAGPMRGISEFNFPLFFRTTLELQIAGYNVFSPAARDQEKYGVECWQGNLSGDLSLIPKHIKFDLREALMADLMWICSEADGIATLPGWNNSKGATAEVATAIALGLPHKPASVWIMEATR